MKAKWMLTSAWRVGRQVFLDLGHIPSVTELHEHEKVSIFGLVSRKQLAAFAGMIVCHERNLSLTACDTRANGQLKMWV